MSRGVRQDYIARIRYQNSLPPPPCPPKLLDVPSPLSSFTSAGFLSALVQQQPLNIDIDAEMGMPLDMTVISGVFDKGDESKLYPDRNPPPMHPKDRLLLRDPSSLGGALKSQPGVSFLRRTEYISTDAVKQARSSRAAAAAAAAAKAAELNDPRKQLESIEETFTQAAEDLKDCGHPTKKGLTVEDSFEVVPDVELFDLTYLLMKMAGSAPGVSGKDETSDPRYDVAVVRPMGTDTRTFMSFFLADQDTAEKFKHKISLSKSEDAEERRLERLRNASPMDEDSSLSQDEDGDEGEVYRFVHTRDYEISSQDTDEITLTFDEESGKAYFHPVGRRVVLKRRRQIQDNRRQKQDPDITNDIAAIEIAFRGLTGEEKVDRDSIRKQQYGYMAE
ncbi:RNA polymerase II-associated [Lipomyces tetrasporus]|uniref:RNA polymerase II-associated n=1 Tax=Lipomyces tetrasporus TaxID=54092 RepID=A0AAD7VVW6_9ASCO|nr:RNA polymerase II-associated [Lipomyces tetrasporus]KAJ8102670.1 RNA polymerase II-associated [Lipomyces tetrasporus]